MSSVLRAHRASHRLRHWHRARLVAGIAFACVVSMSCNRDIPLGPDALKPETFQLESVGGSRLPAFAYALSFGGQVWLKSAQLKSVQPGRSTDPRISDDRSGNGGTGGSTRDSTTVSAQMADIRVFEERDGPVTVVGLRVDSSSVTVERRGDLVLIRRQHPDPARAVVDTGRFEGGLVIVTLKTWEPFGFFPTGNATFRYAVVQ